jgi:predicted Fe-S protein YdhL (DUF1289 family)
MMRDKEIDFKEYSTAVTVCPDCGRHSVLRLNWAYVAAHKGQQILTICRDCALLRISKLKKAQNASVSDKVAGTLTDPEIKPADVVFLFSPEDIRN